MLSSRDAKISKVCLSKEVVQSGESGTQLLRVSSLPTNCVTCWLGPLGSDSDAAQCAGGSLRGVGHPHPRKGREGGLDRRSRVAMPPQRTPPLPHEVP